MGMDAHNTLIHLMNNVSRANHEREMAVMHLLDCLYTCLMVEMHGLLISMSLSRSHVGYSGESKRPSVRKGDMSI